MSAGPEGHRSGCHSTCSNSPPFSRTCLEERLGLLASWTPGWPGLAWPSPAEENRCLSLNTRSQLPEILKAKAEEFEAFMT